MYIHRGICLLLVLIFALFGVQCTRVARQYGGLTNDPEPNSEENLKRVWGAVREELNNAKNNKGTYHLVPIKVLSAMNQNLMTWVFKVLVGESNCKRAEKPASELNSTNCLLREGAKRAIYELTVQEMLGMIQYAALKVRDVNATEVL